MPLFIRGCRQVDGFCAAQVHTVPCYGMQVHVAMVDHTDLQGRDVS